MKEIKMDFKEYVTEMNEMAAQAANKLLHILLVNFDNPDKLKQLLTGDEKLVELIIEKIKGIKPTAVKPRKRTSKKW